MKDVFVGDRRRCRECNSAPVVLMNGYKGMCVACHVCGKSTGYWWRLDDAWLEWEQVINKEVSR